MIRPNAYGTEKSGEHQFPARNITSALRHQVVTDQTDMGSQLENIPALLPHDFEPGFRTD